MRWLLSGALEIPRFQLDGVDGPHGGDLTVADSAIGLGRVAPAPPYAFIPAPLKSRPKVCRGGLPKQTAGLA